jgi:hypothetical protein
MPAPLIVIYEDDREILQILVDGQGWCSADKIVAYREPGEGAYIAWFAFYNTKGEIISRINSKYVIKVNYRSSDKDDLPF